MWEIASTSRKKNKQTNSPRGHLHRPATVRPPPPHTLNAADALNVATSLNTHASCVNPELGNLPFT